MSVLTDDFAGPASKSGTESLFKCIIDWAEKNSAGGRAAREASQLLQLSDEDLAKTGIRRDQVVQTVFAGKGFI